MEQHQTQEISMENVNECARFLAISNILSLKITNILPRNTVISPISLIFSLASLQLGCREETLKELSELIGEKYKPKLLQMMDKHFNQSGIKIANLFIYDENFSPKKNFLDAIAPFIKTIKLDLNNEDGVIDTINHFVSEKTNGLITDIAQKGQFDSAIFTLLNTIYFEGQWIRPFKSWKIRKELFNGLFEIEMMIKNSNFNYYEDNYVQAIRIPYLNSFSLLVTLPKNDPNLSNQYDTFVNTNKMEMKYIELHLPKFSQECEVNLGDVLPQLGVKSLFQNPNLSDMIENKSIDHVNIKQKIVFSTNENGTKAAAATMLLGKLCIKHKKQIKPIIFNANRPFLFSVIYNNVILFEGSYNGDQ